MPKVRHMQGVSAQLETLKKKDERRHPAKCVNVEKIEGIRYCDCPLSPIYKEQCHSAVHCDHYEKKA